MRRGRLKAGLSVFACAIPRQDDERTTRTRKRPRSTTAISRTPWLLLALGYRACSPCVSEYQLEPKSAPRIAHRLPSGIRTTIPMRAERGGGAGLAARKFGHEQRRGEPVETAPRSPSHDGAERIAAEPNHSIDRIIAAQRFLEGQKELAGIPVEARASNGRALRRLAIDERIGLKRRTTARLCARHPARSRIP